MLSQESIFSRTVYFTAEDRILYDLLKMYFLEYIYDVSLGEDIIYKKKTGESKGIGSQIKIYRIFERLGFRTTKVNGHERW